MRLGIWGGILAALAVASVLAACGQAPSPQTAAEAPDAPPAPIWFICDAVDAPTILIAEQTDEKGFVRLREFDKKRGRFLKDRQLTRGTPDQGAGSIMTPLKENDAEVGAVRAVNPGMMEPPQSAIEPFVTQAQLDGRSLACRYDAAMVAIGFSEQRSVLVTRDAAGVIGLRAFDFKSTTSEPSLTVETGAQETADNSVTFVLDQDGRRYILYAPLTDYASLGEWVGGKRESLERMIAFKPPLNRLQLQAAAAAAAPTSP